MKDWTQEGPRCTLSADPRYAVEETGESDYPYRMLIDGYEVDTAETPESARAQLEARYEYEEHYSDLEEARLRLRQAEERLAERYPRAAKDPQLASILSGLADALGRGAEAAEPVSSKPGAGVFGRLLTPDLAIAVDPSQCIVLVVTEPQGKLLRVVSVPSVDAFKAALDDARTAQQVACAEADEARLQGADEARRSRGRLTKREAVEHLVCDEMTRPWALHTVNALGRGDIEERAGMTYDGEYWVVPVTTEQPAR